MCPIGASMEIWIPAKAPATKVVRLESRILITYYHGQIEAFILLEVPEKPQSPHTHTHTQTDMASLKYMMMMIDGTKKIVILPFTKKSGA